MNFRVSFFCSLAINDNLECVWIVNGIENNWNLCLKLDLVDFLASEKAQKLFAEVNFEYPLKPGVRAHPEVVQSLNCQKDSVIDCINVMDVRLDHLGKQMDQTIEMLEELDWF